MLLNKIKIKGFKSFADEVELELEKGITAVVGPNGCGKSNIADSINWALGEQSPSSLRGKRMEQMIFNGSSSRKAMGMAEVTLSLKTHEDLEAVLEFEDEDVEGLERDGASLAELIKGSRDEITITRRMYRDSQSEYLLNGQNCRLKDVQDLLMALGIGTRTITIIEQDRIASIISAKPIDRRVLIEDAAGITKFKLNRHLTTLKIEHSRNNLERIVDLLAEQEVNVGSLRRQAARARRFKRLQDEIREIESNILAVRYSELSGKHTAINKQLTELEEQYARASASLSLAESSEAECRQKIDEMASSKVQKRELFYQKNLELDRDTNRLKFLRENIDTLFKRSKESEKRLEDNSANLQSREEKLKEAENQREKLASTISESSKQLTLLKQEADSADEELRSLNRKKEELSGQLSSVKERRASGVTRLEALKKEENRFAQAVANSKAVLQKTQTTISELENRIQQLSLRKEDLSDRLDEITLGIQRLRKNREDLKQELSALERRIETLKSSRGNAESTIVALEEMEKRHEGIEESTLAILNNEELSAKVKPLGIVADWIEIDPDKSTPAVAAYDTLLESIVVDNEESARIGIELLREREIGRAGFVVLDKPGVHLTRDYLENDLRLAVKGRDEIGKKILQLFSPALIANDISSALEMSKSNPGVKIATADGAVAVDGALVYGGAESISKHIFTRRERMRELRQQVKTVSEELKNLLHEHENMLQKDDSFLSEIEVLQKEAEQLRIQQVELTAQKKAVSDENLRNQESISQARNEIDNFSLQKSQTIKSIDELSEELAEIEITVDNILSTIQSADDQLLEKSEFAGVARQKENELRTNVSTIEERLRSLKNKEFSLKTDLQDFTKRITETKNELEDIEKQRVSSLNEIETIESGMQSKVDSGKVLKEKLRELDIQLDSLNTRLRSDDQKVKESRKEQQAAQSELESIRLRNREYLMELEHLRERASENLKIDIDSLKVSESEDVGIDYQATMENLTELKEKLEKMGPVNLLASEEYDRQLERFNSLNEQREDVVNSIDSLERVIERIDRISRNKFKEAFEKINENFHNIFRVLFQGGKAELSLGEGDLLNAGIEILVQPPGKRLQSASLLSGGEKSLSAFSLILAVMEYRPTPFCILDESDAALDESNIRRIASLVAQRSDHTQFILVTHNKTTMEIADRLYGITMEEPGVSQIVSVDFN